MSQPALWITTILLGVGIFIVGAMWKLDVDHRDAESICRGQGMETTSIRQGSGKVRYSTYICRAPNGQLYSF